MPSQTRLSGFHHTLVPFHDELSEQSEHESESRYNEGGSSEDSQSEYPQSDLLKFNLDISRTSVNNVSSPIPESLARFNQFRQLNILNYEPPTESQNNGLIELNNTLSTFDLDDNESTKSADDQKKTERMYKKLVDNDKNYIKFREKDNLVKTIHTIMQSHISRQERVKLNKHLSSINYSGNPSKNGILDELCIESDDDLGKSKPSN